MANPIFQPQDKIVYKGPKSARYNSSDIPICYIVSGFSSLSGIYTVHSPSNFTPLMFQQIVLESDWRLAEKWEVELYFG